MKSKLKVFFKVNWRTSWRHNKYECDWWILEILLLHSSVFWYVTAATVFFDETFSRHWNLWKIFIFIFSQIRFLLNSVVSGCFSHFWLRKHNFLVFYVVLKIIIYFVKFSSYVKLKIRELWELCLFIEFDLSFWSFTVPLRYSDISVKILSNFRIWDFECFTQTWR